MLKIVKVIKDFMKISGPSLSNMLDYRREMVKTILVLHKKLSHDYYT